MNNDTEIVLSIFCILLLPIVPYCIFRILMAFIYFAFPVYLAYYIC